MAKSIANILKSIGSLVSVAVVTILVAALFTAGMYFVVDFFNFDKKNYVVDETWIDTIGTLTELDHGGSGGASKFSYNYGGRAYEEYSQVDVSAYNIRRGEKYRVRINPKLPEKYVPIDWQPVFTSDEATEATTAKIVGLDHFRNYFIKDNKVSDYSVSFSYIVAGHTYERGQHLPPDFRHKWPDLREGQTYELTYLVSDPARAIISLERPKQ